MIKLHGGYEKFMRKKAMNDIGTTHVRTSKAPR